MTRNARAIAGKPATFQTPSIRIIKAAATIIAEMINPVEIRLATFSRPLINRVSSSALTLTSNSLLVIKSASLLARAGSFCANSADSIKVLVHCGQRHFLARMLTHDRNGLSSNRFVGVELWIQSRHDTFEMHQCTAKQYDFLWQEQIVLAC